jgi:hypothetical protein
MVFAWVVTAAAASAAVATHLQCTGLASLQKLRVQFNMMKYQRLQKDLEPQDTAGLDIAVADTLQNLSQHTQLDAAQVSIIGCTGGFGALLQFQGVRKVTMK